MKQVSGQMSIFDLGILSQKTSPDCLAATKEKISESCSKSSVKSKTKMPMFLNLLGGGGALPEPSWETGIPSLGECSTLVFGESPSVAEESGLWQILQANVPQKYYLSEKACLGVLRRSERRGKELPTILKTALEQQIERWEKYGNPMPYHGNIVNFGLYDTMGTNTEGVAPTITAGYSHQLGDNVAVCVGNVCYDARGNGDGKTVPTITGDHNNRLTDYTAVICETYAGNSSGNDLAGTLDSSYYKGVGARSGKEREFVAIAMDRSAFNQGENAKYNIGVDENGTAFTVTAKGPGAVCYEEKYPAYLMHMREGKEGGGKGALIQKDISGTIACNNDQTLFQHEDTQYIVRRLTPLECNRLQGMPDWWLEGVEGSDAAQYKMFGNGMALPNALYIMEGIAEVENNG